MTDNDCSSRFPGFTREDVRLANRGLVRQKLLKLQQDLRNLDIPEISRFTRFTYVSQSLANDADQWIAFAPRDTLVVIPHIHMVLALWHPNVVWFGINFEFKSHFRVLEQLAGRPSRLASVAESMRSQAGYVLSLRKKSVLKANEQVYSWDFEDEFRIDSDEVFEETLAKCVLCSLDFRRDHPEPDKIYKPVVLFRKAFAVESVVNMKDRFFQQIVTQLKNLLPVMNSLE